MLCRGGTRWSRGVRLRRAIVLSLLIGTSRVMLGVHWPSDVIGGWAFGLLWVLLTLEARGAPAAGGFRTEQLNSYGCPRAIEGGDDDGSRPFTWIAAAIFALMALLHIYRLFTHFQIVLGVAHHPVCGSAIVGDRRSRHCLSWMLCREARGTTGPARR